MSDKLDTIKSNILRALAHPEADEGLFLHNFNQLHQEDERPPVDGSLEEILDALRLLVDEGKVKTDESGSDVIFSLA